MSITGRLRSLLVSVTTIRPLPEYVYVEKGVLANCTSSTLAALILEFAIYLDPA
jgi:hypothetical protein